MLSFMNYGCVNGYHRAVKESYRKGLRVTLRWTSIRSMGKEQSSLSLHATRTGSKQFVQSVGLDRRLYLYPHEKEVRYKATYLLIWQSLQ